MRYAIGSIRDCVMHDETGQPLSDEAALLTFHGVDVAIGATPILHDISFKARAGKTLGIVGESGSGKSMSALAAMRLLPRGATLRGEIVFDGHDMATLDERSLQSIRGGDIGMIFQEPMTALNPVHTIGAQVAESIRLHRRTSGVEAAAQADAILARVGLPASVCPPGRYPHELSGGQRQRVVIAIAIACGPKLLIADEPTTALDVTTQAGILALLRELQREDGLAVVLISHDLAVVADMADDLVVMKDGRVVDDGSFESVFVSGASTHRPPGNRATEQVASGNTTFADTTSDYTASLIRASTWRPDPGTRRASGKELLSVSNLVVSYPTGPRRLFGERARFRAVDDVSFEVGTGESVGLVGESGCGKSTLTRALLGLTGFDAGSIRFRGESRAGAAVESADRSGAPGTVSRALRRQIQIVFQDPYGSFNPRHRVERLVAEPLHLLDRQPDRKAIRQRAGAMLERVGIGAEALRRYIHEFSGGQRQRIAIARALIVEPSLVVLDEAVSALDVSVRAQVLALLADLARDEGLAYLFISHDLSVVRNVTDRVLVMKAGRIVETGPTERVFSDPEADYTRELIAAIPHLPAVH